MEKRSHKYDRIRPRFRHVHKCSKKCLSIMMLVYNKQHQSNIWRSTHEKAKQHEGWVEKKSAAYKNKCVFISLSDLKFILDISLFNLTNFY